MEIFENLCRIKENLFDDIENYAEEFRNSLILVNNLEKQRIKDHKLKESENHILIIITEFMEVYNKIEDKISFIKGKVEKLSIKISFFGTVSAGKSRVLNTILGENLFLSAVSDTTSCFVKVNKSMNDSHSVQYENSSMRHYPSLAELKDKVKELSTNLNKDNDNKLNTDKSVNVFLNINDNKILRPNTQIVDSPGSNNRDDITNCIKKQSLDSDIFIYVMTYTLTNQEKDFFHYQSTLSSKPDIFILVNKWDKSDNDKKTNTDKSKEKIKRELINLLVTEGNFSQEEASKRIFFVSALEMYRHRVEKKNIFANNKHLDAIRQRYDDFNRFEESLSNYIDNPERNKLDRHIREIKDISENLKNSRGELKTKILKCELIEENQNKELKRLGISLSEKNYEIENQIKLSIQNIRENITTKFNDLKTNLNEKNIKDINTKLNIIPTNISCNLIELQNTSNEMMKNMKTLYQEYMGKYKFQNKMNKPTLKDDLKKNIALNMIPEKSLWDNIVGYFWSIFGNNDNENTISDILRENREKIESTEKELKDYVNDFENKLQNYVTNESEAMIEIVKYKLNYHIDYWVEIKKIL